MGVRSHTHIPYPVQQLLETGIPREVSAQDKSVHKKSNQALDLQSITVGDWRADNEVVLIGIAMQQDLERRQQGHEQGNAFLATQRLQPITDGLGQQQRLL